MASKSAMEGTSDPEYLLPERAKEVRRLTDQDTVIVSSMDNKRVLAPFDMSKPGLRILDSATADVFKAVCTYDNIAQSMVGWLREEGLEDVQEERCEIVLGPRCKDPVVAQTSIDITLQAWGALLEVAKNLNAELEESVTENLISRLEKELTQEGGSYYILFAYGRKP
ncbi:hypothetical protein Hte_001930 [Hypoxylon texense]